MRGGALKSRFSQDRHGGKRKAILNRKNFCGPGFSRPSSFHLPFYILSPRNGKAVGQNPYIV